MRSLSKARLQSEAPSEPRVTIRGRHFSSAVSLCRFKDCARHRFRALLPAAGQLRSGVCGVCRPCERGRKRRSETRELHFVEAAAAPVSFWTRGTAGLGPRTFSGCSAGGPGSAGAGRSLCVQVPASCRSGRGQSREQEHVEARAPRRVGVLGLRRETSKAQAAALPTCPQRHARRGSLPRTCQTVIGEGFSGLYNAAESISLERVDEERLFFCIFTCTDSYCIKAEEKYFKHCVVGPQITKESL